MFNSRRTELVLALLAVWVVSGAFGCANGPTGTDDQTDDEGTDVVVEPPPPPPPAPVADFRVSATTGDAPIAITFIDESRGQISSRTWQFPNGQTSDLRTPSYTFGSAGLYTVTLTVTGPGGAAAKRRNLTITEVRQITLSRAGPVIPAKTHGDCDFAGNGPDVSLSARLSKSFPGERRDQEVYLTLTMHARERTHDWSTASGNVNFIVYKVPSGLIIKDFLGATEANWNYTDTDHSYDRRSFSLGTFLAKGDTGGNDICGRTADDTHMFFDSLNFRVRLAPK